MAVEIFTNPSLNEAFARCTSNKDKDSISGLSQVMALIPNGSIWNRTRKWWQFDLDDLVKVIKFLKKKRISIIQHDPL